MNLEGSAKTRPLQGPQGDGLSFAVRAEHDPPFRLAMLELDFIDVGAARPYALESRRIAARRTGVIAAFS